LSESDRLQQREAPLQRINARLYNRACHGDPATCSLLDGDRHLRVLEVPPQSIGDFSGKSLGRLARGGHCADEGQYDPSALVHRSFCNGEIRFTEDRNGEPVKWRDRGINSRG
jgi:hypothetical protein